MTQKKGNRYRKTVLARVEISKYIFLKELAKNECTTISKTLDKIIDKYNK